MTKLSLYLRRTLYILFAGMDFIMGVFHIRKPRVVVLCYHSIAPDDWRFSVSKEKFQEQIEWFRTKGYKFLSLNDIEQILRGHMNIERPSVVLTFDDGYKDILSVKEWLRERDIYPIAFVLSEPDQAALSEVAPGKEFLSSDDLQSLRSDGWEIGCHSATHADFALLSLEEIRHEVRAAKSHLENEIGVPVTTFAYPKGFHSPEIIKTVEGAGYRMAFSMDDGSLEMGSDVLLLPRIGVDRSHTFGDVHGMVTWPAIVFRMLVKKMLTPSIINGILGLK